MIGKSSKLYEDQSFLTDDISGHEWFEKSVGKFDLGSERQGNEHTHTHIAWIVPTNHHSGLGCMIRAEEEVTTWRPGRMLILDDTATHEAWNHTAERRVVLLFDIKRPKKYMISDDDLEAVADMERNHPFSNGGKGNTYLNKLTDEHGWEKQGE